MDKNFNIEKTKYRQDNMDKKKISTETEAQLVKLFNGETLCKPVSSEIKKRDEKIKKLVSEYVLDGDKDADDISQFLNSISQLLLI